MKSLIKRLLGQALIHKIRAGQYFLQSIYLGLGNTVECPLCRRTFSRFLDFAGTRGVWCPSCLSLPRQRLLYLYLMDQMSFFGSSLSVLHFAPERCLSRLIRHQKGIRYVTADLLVSLLPMCDRPDVVMSVTDIDFEDNTFDVVICSHVLEHVRDDRKAMAEILRVLRPGGWAFLQVPINAASGSTMEDPSLSPAQRALQYGFEDHVRLYGLDYPERLRAAGFHVSESDYVRHLDIRRYVLDSEETIYVCRKPDALGRSRSAGVGVSTSHGEGAERRQQ